MNTGMTQGFGLGSKLCVMKLYGGLKKKLPAEGLAYFSRSLPVRSKYRPPSLAQKSIRLFCFVLNAFSV